MGSAGAGLGTGIGCAPGCAATAGAGAGWIVGSAGMMGVQREAHPGQAVRGEAAGPAERAAGAKRPACAGRARILLNGTPSAQPRQGLRSIGIVVCWSCRLYRRWEYT